MICSFDFDGTLTRPEVFEYARELQRRGYIVCINTARCDCIHGELDGHSSNADLLAVAHELNRCRIIFLRNRTSKMWGLFDYGAECVAHIAFHLDDCMDELSRVGRFGVDVTKGNWRQKCEGKLK